MTSCGYLSSKRQDTVWRFLCAGLPCAKFSLKLPKPVSDLIHLSKSFKAKSLSFLSFFPSFLLSLSLPFFLFFFSLAEQHSLWDLSFLTRNQTCRRQGVLTTGPAEKSLFLFPFLPTSLFLSHSPSLPLFSLFHLSSCLLFNQ